MHLSLQEALAELQREPQGKYFATLFTHGSLTLEIYGPEAVDRQQPHLQDELYLIISGTGIFVHEATEKVFQPGDAIFVPAGNRHHFKNFSANFKTWVIFYGPPGGEKNYHTTSAVN
jgi:mannose-6-phosphate isomerase-like protein (cupin superfamily)